MDLSNREQHEAINEVAILAKLDSPYVVKYFDSFIHKDSLFIGRYELNSQITSLSVLFNFTLQ